MRKYTEIFIKNKLRIYFSFSFVFINCYLFVNSLNKLNDNFILYSIFFLLSTVNVLNVICFKSSLFEKFLNFYMWLGYFFFYSIHVIYFNETYNFPTGDFNFKSSDQREELYYVLIVFNFAILFTNIISNKYINYTYTKSKTKFNNFFNNNINIFLILLFLLIIFISFSNIYLKYFDYYYFFKSKNPFFIDAFFKWFFLFGFSSIMCVFLNLNETKKIIIKLFIISSIQEYLFFFSILSRGCIFNSLAILIALFLKCNLLNEKLSFQTFLALFLLIFTLFIINFYTLIDLRGGDNEEYFKKYRSNSKFNSPINNFNTIRPLQVKFPNFKEFNFVKIKNENINSNNNTEKSFFQDFKPKMKRILFSVKNRVFGIDSLMVVVGHKDKNLNFFINSLKEKFQPGKSSYFDKLRFNKILNQNSGNLTVPGFLAFTYYSGSLLFVFILTILVIFICNIIEKINVTLNNNIFFSALISQILAYRVWHFGYAPLNSYKIYFAIIGTILFIYIFQKVLINLKILVK